MIVAVSGVIFIFSLGKLIAYGLDYASYRKTSVALKEIYYQEVPSLYTPEPYPQWALAPTVLFTPMPTTEPIMRLDAIRYPDNPSGRINSRFEKIRRQNSDIIGWLTIEDLLDEAIVQRDNSYYLRRDYRGYHNVNGAIFLDEACDLTTRPYTLLLYGHNMKSGMMFGCLRNYENVSFYRNNPFINFDTAYEDGHYVIFSVGTMKVGYGDRDEKLLAKLNSTSVALRQEAIDALQRSSKFHSEVDAVPEDQLLLLITCVDDEDERRMLAARRIRKDEDKTLLRKLIRKAQAK